MNIAFEYLYFRTSDLTFFFVKTEIMAQHHLTNYFMETIAYRFEKKNREIGRGAKSKNISLYFQ